MYLHKLTKPSMTFYTLRCLFLGDWRFLKPFLTKPKSATKLARN